MLVMLVLAPAFLWIAPPLIQATQQDDGTPPAPPPVRVEVVDETGAPVPGAEVYALPGENYTAAYQRVMVAEDRQPVAYEVIEEYGKCQVADVDGVVFFERSTAGLNLIAKAPGAFALVF